MNGKYLKIVIYTSLFSAAYGGFFYQRSTVMQSVTVTPVVAENAVTEDQATASTSLLMTRDSYLDKSELVANTNANDVSEMPAFKREKRVDDKRTDDKGSARYDSSFTSAAVYPGARYSTYSKQISYSQQDLANRTTTRFSATTGLSYTPIVTNPDNSSASQNTLTTSSNTSNKNSSEIFVDQNLAESDGSEFLPDGSSQQDLFNANSKKPRVYTIKDYQTADISCAPGYDDASSPHAQLIRGLKGC